MKNRIALSALFAFTSTVALASLLDQEAVPQQDDSELLVSLGINNNDDVVESSGLACSRFVEDSIWTLNDSGNTNELLLLKTDGTLQAKVAITGARNIDWEAMAGFELEGQPRLIVADIGDNLHRRKSCQLYLLREPDLAADLKSGIPLPIKKSVAAVALPFTYQDGPKDCEAIGVDVAGKQIWMVEKVYYTAVRKSSPGIYVLPLTLDWNEGQPPLVAKRIADFRPRNVTGMDFSPDGKQLIIRNYVNAHLFTRNGNESWASVVSRSKPATIVLPLQRQGEAICFSRDSQSVILTSELKSQPIWQVKLQQPVNPADAKPDKEKPKNQPE